MNSRQEHESPPGAGGTCPRCGAALPANVAPDLCPKCLLQAALPTQADLANTEQIPETPAPAHSAGLPRPGDQLGHYRIVRLLGEGGMGAVFDAEDLENGRRVALKVLGQKLDSPAARERFFREGRIAAAINHPNSVYVFGTEEICGIPVIAMELVSGGTLQERVQKTGALPVGEAVDSVLQIIQGLEAAQRLGILHRDVKPSNCFVDADGTVKIGDFGLSISATVRTEPALTATGIFLGTPAFCSPEQLRGDELNLRSDMYSVGATLFFLLTSHTPFEGKNAVQLMASALERKPLSPAKLRPAVPLGLAGVVLRCLEKQPGNRFKNYHELAAALAPYGSAAPTPATFGLRTAAGLLDQLLLGVVAFFVLWLFGKNPVDFLNMAGKSSPLTLGMISAQLTVALVYYALFEGLWGAALGKAVCRLRVAGPNRNPPGFARALLRALIFVVTPAVPFWAYYGLINPGINISQPLTVQYILSSSYYVILALLFCTARRRNGFAAVQDRLTTTRVISRVALAARPELQSPELPAPSVEAKPMVGPYHVLETLEQAGQTQWLQGFDLRLLRRVWLRVVPPGTPPVPPVSRNLGRVGRLRWLAGRRSASENWDAFEALSGQPLLALLNQRQPWRQVRFWLYDLAQELSAAARDGTVPVALSLDRLWITGDGRIKLLDFPAPGFSTAATGGDHSVPPCRFLNEVAVVALVGRPDALATADPPLNVPLPIHAREFLVRLPKFPDPDVVTAALKPLLQRVATVTRGRRAAIVAACLAVPMLTGTCFTLGMKIFTQWNLENPGLMELNTVLAQHTAMNSRWLKAKPHPSDRQFAIYIASHYRSVVTNEAIWNGTFTRAIIKGPQRRFAERSVAEYASPTADEIKDADAALKGPLDAARAFDFSRNPWLPWFMAETTLVIYVALPALIAALAFRGGLILLSARVTFVRRDGARASRLRVFWRVLAAWSGFVVAFLLSAALSVALKRPIGSFEISVLFLLLSGSLVVISLALPERGLQDRVAGTWPVPR
ncbi:MAG TPA: protein kinase [Candidatus Acidoferrales bacterium]|nr:protein kinase [Candidatus Acidoferrales bacterium]